MGSKVIGCHMCTLDIHGKVRTPTWTMISKTENAGDTTITTIQDVDWEVGEVIVIASSSWDHNEAERKTIKAINGRVITLDSPLTYKHYIAIEVYGSENFSMRTEVMLLNRNIVI